MKQCAHCGEIKPRSEFNKSSRNLSGLNSWCRECNRANCRKHAEENREQRRQYNKNRQPRENARRRARYAADQAYAERLRRRVVADYAVNSESKKRAVRVYQRTNRDKILPKKRAYYTAKKSMLAVAVRAWKKENREALRDYFHKRRALLKNAGGSHSKEQIAELLERQNGLCAVCLIDIRNRKDRDHIIPLSAGGSNDISNIQLLCPSCNYAKRAKSMEQFLKERSNARDGPEPIPGRAEEV